MKKKFIALADATHRKAQKFRHVAAPPVSNAKTSSKLAAKAFAAGTASVTHPRLELGRAAEVAVARSLTARGYEIVATNARVGRLEIDVIARKGNLIVMCEVRARRDVKHLHPAYCFDHKKIERVRRAAARWVKAQNLRGVHIRIDAAAVHYKNGEPQIDYFKNISMPTRTM